MENQALLTAIQRWLDRDPDPETRAEIVRFHQENDWPELHRRFAQRLAFGTAGLRGLLGAGPNRMNRLVVQETTAGLADYLATHVKDAQARGVVIGYDGRRGSLTFAQDAAAVLVHEGFKVFLGATMLTTPSCAFAVVHYGAAAGIVITASHNPPDYNGYKVYWENGAQIIPPHDAGIAHAIENRADREGPDALGLADLSFERPDDPRNRGLLHLMGDDLVETYLGEIKARSLRSPGPGRTKLKIAYTPLHGVGADQATRALARAGFDQVAVVPSQAEPDGNFPTVRFPNPEEPGAMDEVLALAEEKDAHLAIANDPDADRLAVAVRTGPARYRMLTGDQIGILLGAEVLERRDRPLAVATTIVSSGLLGRMAEDQGATYFETLTGFKWIANGALDQEAEGIPFGFGYEEALGYTVGDLVRDKDGISAIVAFAELAAAVLEEGITVLDHLEGIYRRYGLYATKQKSIWLDADTNHPPLGDALRARPPQAIGGREVVSVTDYAEGITRFSDGRTEPVAMPQADVLTFRLAGDGRVIVRPSGTEPKLKCYYELRAEVREDEPLNHAELRLQGELEELVAQHQEELEGWR